MAFQPRSFIRKLSDDEKIAYGKTAHLKSTTDSWKYLKKKIKPLTPISKIRDIAQKSEKLDTPIVVSSKAFDELKMSDADGLAVEYEDGKCKVFLHPFLQFTPQSFVKDVIRHEYDHIKVFKKQKGVQKPISSRISRIRS